MKILSNSDIKDIAKYTIDNDGVTSVQLVEHAPSPTKSPDIAATTPR